MAKAFEISDGKAAFAKNVFTVMSGRTFAVAITFLATPIVARLFDPEDWGVAILFISFSAMIGPLSCLRFEKAIPVAKNDSSAFSVAVLCSILVVSVAVLALGVAGVVRFGGLQWDMLDRMGPWIWLLPLGIFLEGHAAIFEAYLTRVKRFTSQATGEVLQALTRSGSRIGYGAQWGSSVSGLIGSYLLAYTAKIVLLLRYCRQPPKLEMRLESKRRYTEIGAEFGDFPRYNAPTALLMSASRQLPIYILAAFFGPAAVGMFGMADRVVRTPAHVSSNSVRKVFLQRIAEIWNSGRPIRRPTLQTVAALGAAGIVPCLILWLFGQEIITFFLGPNWEVAGRYSEIMAPYLFVQWLGPPFQGAAIVMGAQRLWFLLQLFVACTRLIVIPIAIWVATSAETIIATYIWLTISAQIVAMCVVASRLEARRSDL